MSEFPFQVDEALVKLALGDADNTNCTQDMRCPKCLRARGGFKIGGNLWNDDGCVESNDDWTAQSECVCLFCGYTGLVWDFKRPEVTPELLYRADDLVTWMDGLLPVSITAECNLQQIVYRLAYEIALAYQQGFEFAFVRPN